MARLADKAALQAAKGNPGRRKGEMDARAASDAAVEARLAAAPLPAVSRTVQPPARLTDNPAFAEAATIWAELAPRLAQTYRLDSDDRIAFESFCIYAADFIALSAIVATEGHTQSVKTVSGDDMIREHPAAKRLDKVHGKMMELAARFGLTPSDRFSLFKDQSAAASRGQGWLFEAGAPGAKPADALPASEAPMATSVPGAGILKDFDSAPPTAH